MGHNKKTESEDGRINIWLEKIALSAITLGVAATASFQWYMYTKIEPLIGQHDVRISELERRVTILESQMIGWDTLKRIELYLSSMSPEAADSAMLKAIRAETASRKMKKEQGE